MDTQRILQCSIKNKPLGAILSKQLAVILDKDYPQIKLMGVSNSEALITEFSITLTAFELLLAIKICVPVAFNH